jgi:MFS family permease
LNDEAGPPPPATDGAVADTGASLWQHRAFVRLWISTVSTSFGFQMLSVAIGWQVYAITGSALDLGLIGLVQFVPSLVLALPAGHVADRYERRRVVLIAQIVVLFAIAMLAVLTAADRIHELGIFAILFTIGIAMAFEWPAQRSMLPSLVPAAILPRAMAMNSSGDQAASIVGPALGGLLYIAGPQVVYAVAALLYFVSVVTMSRLPYRQVESKRESATWKSVFAGVHFIRRNPDMLGVISLDLFAVLLGGATALLPIFARDILHTGPVGLGMLRGAPAVGALLMSLWLARRAIERNVGMTMFAAVAGFGLATLMFAWSTALWLSLIALFALGAFDMVSVVIRSALVQLDTPDDMRGRVNSVNAVFVNTSNQLGEFESGLLAAWVGAVPAVLIGGVGTLLIVGLWMAIFPTLRRRQRMQSDALRPAYDPN